MRRTKKGQEGRAGVALLRAALKLKTGAETQPERALREALKDVGVDVAGLRKMLGPDAQELKSLIRPARRKQRLRHPMR